VLDIIWQVKGSIDYYGKIGLRDFPVAGNTNLPYGFGSMTKPKIALFHGKIPDDVNNLCLHSGMDQSSRHKWKNSYAGVSPISTVFTGFTYVMVTISTPQLTAGAVYWGSMVRHFTGHVSTQELQTTQRKRSICQVFSSFCNKIACDGHFLWQVPQEIHRLSSMITCPRVSGVFFAGSAGYRIVAGRWRTVLNAVFAISKNAMVRITSPYN